MWWFALIYFLNSVLPHNSLVYEYRVNIGVPINILDALIFFGCGLAILPMWRTRAFPVYRSHPAWAWGLSLLILAGLIGILQSYLFFPDIPIKYRLPVIRNYVLVPASLFAAYQMITQPRQAKTVFWIIFISSLGSASMSILTAGYETARIAGTSGSGFDSLRQSALDVAGDAGMLSGSIVLFSLVSGIRFLPGLLAYASLVVSAVGMFFVPHRSHWLVDFITGCFAAFFLWPTNRGRKWLVTMAATLCVVTASGLLVMVVELETGKDFGGWISKRLESLLPDENSRDSRAWDTRLPTATIEFQLWLGNPLLGRGFGVQEANSIQTGTGGSFRHTPWVSTLTETGLPGLAGFVLVIGGCLAVGIRLARHAPDKWFALVGAAAASWGVASIWFGMFTLSWNSPRPAITLGLMAGAVFRLRDFAFAVEAQALPELEQQWESEVREWQEYR